MHALGHACSAQLSRACGLRGPETKCARLVVAAHMYARPTTRMHRQSQHGTRTRSTRAQTNALLAHVVRMSHDTSAAVLSAVPLRGMPMDAFADTGPNSFPSSSPCVHRRVHEHMRVNDGAASAAAGAPRGCALGHRQTHQQRTHTCRQVHVPAQTQTRMHACIKTHTHVHKHRHTCTNLRLCIHV